MLIQGQGSIINTIDKCYVYSDKISDLERKLEEHVFCVIYFVWLVLIVWNI